jgi:hypothetical protein
MVSYTPNHVSNNDNYTGTASSFDDHQTTYYCIANSDIEEYKLLDKKQYCYFLSFVLFLLAHKGILPLMRREINMREMPFGFG